MMKNLTLEHIAAACHGTYYGPEEKKSVHRSSDNGQPENRKTACLFRLLVQEQTVTNLSIRSWSRERWLP